jgi:hypothetical protein
MSESTWMITSDIGHPPIVWEYPEPMEQPDAVDLLKTMSEEEGHELYLWKLIKHTTVNVNASVVDD